MSRAKKDGFIMQAGILAAAGILSRIIGLLYNSPMTAIIGDEGNGYYELAYRAYTIVLLISSYSIPSAIAKVIAGYLAIGEYRNAHRIFKGALYYVIVIGGIAALLVFFFANTLVNLSSSATVLRFFAPTVFLSGILGVLRGYFQAHRTMAQTSVSQILEQILNALASILLAFWLTGMVPLEEATRRSVYGAAGGAVGTGFGVITGIIFMWAVYAINKKTIHKRIDNDTHKEDISYKAIYKMIMLVVTPFILSTCIYNINTFLNPTIFSNVMMGREAGESVVAAMISAVGKATKISNIPIAISSAMSAALIPGIAGDFAMKRLDFCRDKVAKAIRTTMFIAIPAAIGITALARPLMLFLYPQEATLELSTNLLRILSLGVVFYSLSTLSSAVLQGTGRVNSPVINAAISLFIQTAVLVILLYFTDLATYSIAVSVLLFAFLMCVMNGLSVHRHLEYRQEWDRTFIRPLIISIIMALTAYGTYYGFYYLIGINLVSLFIAVLVGVLVYFVIAVRWQVLGEAELRWLPKNERLIRLVNNIGVVRLQDKKIINEDEKNEFEFEFVDNGKNK